MRDFVKRETRNLAMGTNSIIGKMANGIVRGKADVEIGGQLEPVKGDKHATAKKEDLSLPNSSVTTTIIISENKRLQRHKSLGTAKKPSVNSVPNGASSVGKHTIIILRQLFIADSRKLLQISSSPIEGGRLGKKCDN